MSLNKKSWKSPLKWNAGEDLALAVERETNEIGLKLASDGLFRPASRPMNLFPISPLEFLC